MTTVKSALIERIHELRRAVDTANHSNKKVATALRQLPDDYSTSVERPFLRREADLLVAVSEMLLVGLNVWQDDLRDAVDPIDAALAKLTPEERASVYYKLGVDIEAEGYVDGIGFHGTSSSPSKIKQ